MAVLDGIRSIHNALQSHVIFRASKLEINKIRNHRNSEISNKKKILRSIRWTVCLFLLKSLMC